ncbi:hypothetical protein FACS189435_1040 [Bacteroidia bacterium]|nr:hypothetical protein FACS189435_1040 [Bacteroidia bacterium]
MRAQTSIKYIDADGIEKTATATAITNGSELKDGWYYVSGKVEVTGRITVNATGDGANIILEDDCDFTVTDGIQVGGTNQLTIYGQSTGTNTGKLTANVTSNDAGIGGNEYGDGGTITINGGTVTATSINGAGIGGGSGGYGGTIAINGGTVTATSGYGAGIGGGYGGSGGTITINGGTVEATGKEGGAGIGGGMYGSGGDITISGGTVKATGGYGAGIGGGFNGDGGTIAINGGTVEATGGGYGAGIGSGGGSGGIITIDGGTVTATGAAGMDIGTPSGGTVTITGGSIQAGSFMPQPTNGNGEDVYLNTLELYGVATVTSVAAGSINGTDCANAPDAASGVYGIKDVQTDAAGKVYFYLPASGNGETIRLADGSNYYQETFARPANITAKTLNKEVTAAAIDGVTLPVAGATPVAAITETEQYTGTVSWNGNPSTFAPATTYTATITLTPKTGYTLAGVIADFFTVTGATTVANSAGSGVITAEFPAAAPPPTYDISIGSFTGGSVSANKASAAAGETVTLTVYPASGYELSAISVFKTGYPTVSVGLNGFNGVNGLNGDFTMPDHDVTVSASFTEIFVPEPEPDQDAVDLDGFISAIRYLHVNVPQEEANTESEVADWLKAYLARLFEEKGWDISVHTLTVVDFVPATAGTRTDVPANARTRTDVPGTNGSFSFFAMLKKGYVIERTYNMDGTVTATRYTTPTGNESAEASRTSVYFRNHTLYICSPAAETVEVYSFSGAKLFSAKKDVGEAVFIVPASREAVIVRGSSGWTRKAIDN